MPIAMTPSQMAVPEPSSSSAAATAAAAAVPAAVISTAAAGPGAPGPLSVDSAPGCSGGPVHGLTCPSAYVWKDDQIAVPSSNGVPSIRKSA